MKKKLLLLVTPGEILKEEFLNPLGISEYRLGENHCRTGAFFFKRVKINLPPLHSRKSLASNS